MRGTVAQILPDTQPQVPLYPSSLPYSTDAAWVSFTTSPILILSHTYIPYHMQKNTCIRCVCFHNARTSISIGKSTIQMSSDIMLIDHLAGTVVTDQRFHIYGLLKKKQKTPDICPYISHTISVHCYG